MPGRLSSRMHLRGCDHAPRSHASAYQFVNLSSTREREREEEGESRETPLKDHQSFEQFVAARFSS